ncbi:MAG TPA: glycosyltransferase family 4 protein [Candidatus Dormibacteraeota bacterium]
MPPTGYGGIEAVVHLLARELIKRGHEVTTFAVEGSDPLLHPISLAPAGWGADLGTPEQRIRESTYQLRVNRELLRRVGQLDLIHLHTEFPGMAAASLLRLPVPCLATVHSGIDEKVLTFLGEVDEDIDLVAISQAQKEMAQGVRWRAVVHNAVPIDDVEVRSKKEGYLLELARITPDKGQHLAIEVAERVGMPLVLAGKVDRDAISKRYFEKLIKPRLSSTIRWVENVGDGDKADLLAGAEAMLFPIQWEEPFGLAMVEAMVCGTPAVAFNRGAAREIVEPGLTGFLVDSVDEMVARVKDVGTIDPIACSNRARDRFSPARMADGYEAAYREVLNASAPLLPGAASSRRG